MLVRHSYDSRFISLMDKLRKQYGEEMFALEGIGENQLDLNRYSKDFFGNNNATADKTIDSNANASDMSVLAWEAESSKSLKKINALYCLWKHVMNDFGIKRANKIIEHEINGAIRLHDAHLWLKPYCWASSMMELVNNGMPFYEKISIGPIKHFDSFINLSLQYICYASNQLAGALALPDFFIYCDYFIRKDFGEDWYNDEKIINKINQLFQNWIYSVNFSWRSNQSPFVNLSVFDKYWMEALFTGHANPDFSKPNFENVDRVQKMFVNEMVRNLQDNPFTFPVMTACMLTDKDSGKPMDREFLNFVCDVVSENGLFNIYVDSETSSLSSCCRLRNSIDEANKEYTNSFGVGGLSVGSHRVVTINLPQIAYVAEDWRDYMKLLEYRVNIAHDILDIHRKTMQKLIDDGRLPLYKYGFMNLDRQFSTIGFMGMNEAIELLGYDILDKDGHKKAKEILDLINSMNDKRSKQDGNIRNVEQVPGEGAASTFAKKDKLQFDDASYELYSNQYIPLTKETDMVNRIIAQGRFDSDVGGGSILHLNCMEKVESRQVKKLIEYSSKKGVVYFAINYNFSQCKTCHKVYVGKMDKSPCHNADVKKYLRVVGFLSEVSNWGKPRREEYKNRQFYVSGEEKILGDKKEKNDLKVVNF